MKRVGFYIFIIVTLQSCQSSLKISQTDTDDFLICSQKRFEICKQPDDLIYTIESPVTAEDKNDFGVARARLFEYDEAERLFQESYRQKPGYMTPLLNLARLYLLLKENYRARMMLSYIATDTRINPVHLFEKGKEYLHQNRREEGLFLLEELHETGRNTAQTGIFLGSFYLTEGNLAKAEKFYKDVLSINAGEKEALFGLGFLYAEKKEYLLAADFLEKSYDAGMREEDLCKLTMESLYFSEDISGAKRFWKKCSAGESEMKSHYGFVLLLDDYKVDLNFLLTNESAERRKELMQLWYGSADPVMISDIMRFLRRKN